MFKQKRIIYIFTILVFGVLLVPLVYWAELLYPLVTTKALLFKTLILGALPFYLYLFITEPKTRPELKNPLTLSLCIFVVISFLSAFMGQNITRSLLGNFERMGGVVFLVYGLLLYLYLQMLAQLDAKRFYQFLQGVFWVSVLACIYGVWVVAGFPKLFPDPSLPRVSSTFGNPIFFASYLIISLGITLFLAAREERRFQKRVYVAGFLLQLLNLYLTGTRGAFVGLLLGIVIGSVVYFFLSKTRTGKVWSGGVILAIIIVISSALFLGGTYNNNSLIKRATSFKDSNTTSRLIQWKMALRGFKDHPVLGVGPENYNLIANTYFDKTLYQYDHSWFDKPHNLPLELLSTYGSIGLLSYLAIIIATLWVFFKGMRSGLLSLFEFVVLATTVVTYQIQNLFVFDTVSAFIMFIVLSAFAGYIWTESAQSTARKKAVLHPFAPIIFWSSVGAVLVLVYLQVIIPARILTNINMGFAIDIKNPELAKESFDRAAGIPFNYDPGELGVKYEEFAIRVAQDSPKKSDTQFVNAALDGAIGTLERAVQKTANNPIYWYKLGNLYNTKAFYNKTDPNPRAEFAIEKSISLVPTRIEPLFFLVQTRALQHRTADVLKISEDIVAAVPSNAEAKWRLALAYKDAKRDEDAVRMGELALSQGYQFKLVREFQWLINYYVDKGNFTRVATLYEQAVALSPGDDQLYEGLAAVYAKLGEKEKAIAAARKVAELKPERAADVEAFIKAINSK